MHVRALCFTEYSCTRRKSVGGRWSPADITETGKVEVPRCEDTLESFNDKKMGRVRGSMRLYQDSWRAGDILLIP